MSKILYFGCIKIGGQVGHYLWQDNVNHTDEHWAATHILPGINKNVLKYLDGVFTPAFTSHQGFYVETLIAPHYKIIAWWDYTADSRPGSNSVLIGPANLSADEMFDIAEKIFPRVMERQPRPVPAQFINPQK